jgi:hypothetical protein
MPRDVILKAAGGWDVIEVQDVLRELDQRKSRAAVDVDGRRATAEDEELSHSTPV